MIKFKHSKQYLNEYHRGFYTVIPFDKKSRLDNINSLFMNFAGKSLHISRKLFKFIITCIRNKNIGNTKRKPLAYVLQHTIEIASLQCVHFSTVLRFFYTINLISCPRLRKRPPVWFIGRSSWLQIQRSEFNSRSYQIFWEIVGLERSPPRLVSTTEELFGEKVAAPV
jgi:hypothetical protein